MVCDTACHQIILISSFVRSFLYHILLLLSILFCFPFHSEMIQHLSIYENTYTHTPKYMFLLLNRVSSLSLSLSLSLCSIWLNWPNGFVDAWRSWSEDDVPPRRAFIAWPLGHRLPGMRLCKKCGKNLPRRKQKHEHAREKDRCAFLI